MADFMKKAIEEACTGIHEGHGGPFGAVIVRNNEIIATGHNTVLATNDPTAHAEVNAIRNASMKLKTFDLKDCQMYATCYPCPMCFGAALWARLSGIYYAACPEDAARSGFDDKAFHDFLKSPRSDEHRVIKELKVDGYMRPFDEWQQLATKRPY